MDHGLNVDSAYAFFSLFFTDEIFYHISRSTNEYARLKRGDGSDENDSPGTTSHGSRPWKDTTAADIKVFAGILIYMGANPLPQVEDYWHQDSLHRRLLQPHMALRQFQQIKRYLHTSWQDTGDPCQPDSKLEPLASSFEEAARQYHPGSNISVDEATIRCFGRSFAETACVWRKYLENPKVIDDYNRHLGGDDIANRYRSSYDFRYRAKHPWFALFFIFLDASVVIAYCVECIAKEQQNQATMHTFFGFRNALWQGLFDSAGQAARPRPNRQTYGVHHRIHLGKRFDCAWCQFKREKGKRAPRAGLGCMAVGSVGFRCV
ncbi:hypothetical protein N7535_009012 [Penicillium sp. DV-2018c]|nr:hypothetical protein N7461_003096 [Penicillium sp. DV-2018c]KAJ5560815.1 hypothetical protein N7535_009012 [Penicillium sp. DV-2018c]